MRTRPPIRLIGIERSPLFPVEQIGGRFLAAGALRLHAAAGDQLAQHLAEQRAPLVLRRRAAFGVDHPLFRFAAQFFGELFGAVREDIAEPGLAPGAAFEQLLRRLEIAPFELQAVGAIGTEHALFPGFERQAGAAGEVAALDAEIVDSFGEIEDVVALEAQVVKSVHPLAAGIEMADLAGVASFADFNVPGAHARALETGTKRHAILIQAFGFVGDDRAAPVELGDAAPVFAVADAG